MYVKCKNTDDALKVFDKMHERVLVTWNSLIVVNANNGHNQKALRLFYHMQEVGIQLDQFSFYTTISTCTILDYLKEIHEDIRSRFQCNLYVGSALIDMHARYKSIEDAHCVLTKWCVRSANELITKATVEVVIPEHAVAAILRKSGNGIVKIQQVSCC